MKNDLKNKIIYQVYVRNFTKEGTFKGVTDKLDYIKSLGTDILYLLPINPIGKTDRKGKLGCPYSIKNYLKINKELGTLDDFKNLIDQTHKKDMKLIIDIVFNHTSKDSFLLKNHPEWFYKNKEGEIVSKCEDRTDVVDLNYENNNELVIYLIDVIKYYIDLGVDGFRFDVASLVGKNFYQAMKREILSKNPNLVLIGECIDSDFINLMRSRGHQVLSDAELYELGFDLLYEYPSWWFLKGYLETNNSELLTKYKVLKNYESTFNPQYGLRIRGIENHDQKRLCEFSSSKVYQRNLAAFSFFSVGPAFVYNGLETKADHHLSLFDKDVLDLSIDQERYEFILTLLKIKKENFNLNILLTETETVKGSYILQKNYFNDEVFDIGVFILGGEEGVIISKILKDGKYLNLLDHKEIVIKNNLITTKEPLYLRKI